jgi:hypothetical protein
VLVISLDGRAGRAALIDRVVVSGRDWLASNLRCRGWKSPPDITADDTKMAYEYRYGLASRPAGIGYVPSNKPYRLEPPLSDEEGRLATRHGVIVFERPLTVDDLYAFDLALLADEDLKSALATEIAIEFFERFAEPASQSEQSEQSEPFPLEYSADFCRMVVDTLSKIRLYRVYVGDLANFSKLVLSRLKGLAEKSSSQDAEVLSILHAKQYTPQQAAL